MTQLLRETKEWGHTNKSKSTNEHTKLKPRLKFTHKKTLSPIGLYELVLVAVHMENFECIQPKCQEPLQLLSPLFLMTSTTIHETDEAKRNGGLIVRECEYGQYVYKTVLSRTTLH